MTNVPLPVQHGVTKLLGSSSSLLKFLPVGGGCINHGGKLITSTGTFFLKWNDAHRYPGMFAQEAKGLNLLRSTRTICIPAVIGLGEEESFQFLILEFIEQGSRSNSYWKDFGSQMALLHSNRVEWAGLNHNNYIGSLTQTNLVKSTWLDFFIHERLVIQLDLADSRSLIPAPVRQNFEKLFIKLPSLLPVEASSLLHGDLWSGNLITSHEGAPCLIDPAVYYGNREVDLAMTQLFGGFDSRYLDSYHEALPLLPGYEERFDIYNLYPLLVHVNLFGQGYLAQVNSILTRYVS
ncbi:MAG TPA: fructosamine kinase family protein [Ohtaekwangia sp.]